jgi:hypothetical protein
LACSPGFDHSNGESEDAAPTVTGVYVRYKRIRKSARCSTVSPKALRQIVGTKPPATKRPKLELVA